MPTISTTDRKRLIRLASTLPKGSEKRKAILSGLGKVERKAAREPIDIYPPAQGYLNAIQEELDWNEGAYDALMSDVGWGVTDLFEKGKPVNERAVQKLVQKSLAPYKVERDVVEEVASLIWFRRVRHIDEGEVDSHFNRSASLQSKGLKAIKVASDSIPLWIPVQGRPQEVMPANNTDFKLREVQKLVGGYVEVVYLRDGRIMLVDEEGLLKQLPLNRAASRMAGRPIVGNAVVMPNDMFR